MLKSQEITLAQSQRRERMAEIQKAGEVTDDARTELRSLTEAYQGAEVELRAALILETEERDKIKEPDNAEKTFEAECRQFDLSSFVAELTADKGLTGREAEVSQELEQRHGEGSKGARFPWEALTIETRADAETTAAASADLASRPTMTALERFFEASAAQRFGVQTIQVNGNPSFPEISGGTGLSWVAEGTGADAAAISTTAQTPSIHTATGRYLLSRQAIRKNAVLSAMLRRDLGEVLREGVDLAVFQGSGTSEQPGGFANILDGQAIDVSDKASFSTLLLHATQLQETAKLSDPSQVRIAGAPILHQTLADTLITGTAVSELDRLKSAGFSPMFSQQVSTRGARDGTDKGASTVYMSAGRSNAYLVNWGSPELLVDPYSESKTGRVALTMFSFVDILVQRAATHFAKLEAVQDRA